MQESSSSCGWLTEELAGPSSDLHAAVARVTAVLPLLYLHGLSTGDLVLTLSAFFGSEAGPSVACAALASVRSGPSGLARPARTDPVTGTRRLGPPSRCLAVIEGNERVAH